MVIYFFQTIGARHSGPLHAAPVAGVHSKQAVPIFFIFAQESK